MKKLVCGIILAFSTNIFTLSYVAADPVKHSIKSTTKTVNRAIKSSIRFSLINKTYKTTTRLNMRTEPFLSGSVIDVLKKGSKVMAYRQQGDWLEVSVNGNTGWVHSRYLSK